MLAKLLLCVILPQVFSRPGPRPSLVKIPTLGKIEGGFGESHQGRIFHAFEGVPYAKPPVGKNRFEAPEPPKPWDGVWTAQTIYKCMQSYNTDQVDRIVGDEDCLYLNIYTPTLERDANLDVIIYIHGGAFMYNYGGLHGPKYIMDRGVVYVNFNYRLGPLGFLSTEDDVIPGNNGLKDQILALKFVKNYIKHFGGNPNSITLLGMSAGGASVNFHYFSTESRGLFNRGISQSGTLLDCWVLTEEPLQRAKKLAQNVGCTTKNTAKMAKCLKNRPGRQIVQQVQSFQPWLYNPFAPFAIVVDKWAKKPLLSDHPINLIRNKQFTDLPWIASYTGSEGLYPGSFFYSGHHLRELDNNWNKYLPHILDYNYTAQPELHDLISEKIREKYLGDAKLTKSNFVDLLPLLNDRLFKTGIRKSLKLQADAMSSPVYMYQYTYRGTHSKSEGWSGSHSDFGASHGDDTANILYLNMDMTATENDQKIQKLMLDLVTSFAKTGKPEVEAVSWAPLTKNASTMHNLLISDPSNITMVDQSFTIDNFWGSLPIKENEKILEQ